LRYAAVLFDLLTALLDSWSLWDRVAGGPEAGRRWRMRYPQLTYGAGRYRPYAVRDVRPDLYKGFNPWDRICDPPALRQLLAEGGVDRAEVVAEAGTHPIPSPKAWWSAVLGTGYRGTLEQLDAKARERVRAANLDYIRSAGIRSVEANVVYALAPKP
jgi:hypothetical protein